ncbi:DnaA/Hda family protein [Fibrobacterales bacterium]|nr:DnaA/Hda family protein [Fibrobacterales bacterium]
MKSVLCVGMIAASVFAWDGKREGFIFGFGAGASSLVSVNLDANEGDVESSSQLVPTTTSVIGYAWDNQTAIVLRNTGMGPQLAYNGINFQKWSTEKAQSNVFYGGAGLLVGNNNLVTIKGGDVKLSYDVQNVALAVNTPQTTNTTPQAKVATSNDIGHILNPIRNIKPTSKAVEIDGLTEDKPLNPDYRLKNYVVGHSNELAFQSISRIAEAPGTTVYNPLILHGCTGTGKTHLLHGLIWKILETHTNLKIIVRTGEELLKELSGSFSKGRQFALQKKLRSVDLLLIDDVQFLAKGPKSQEELAGIVAYLTGQGKQVVFISDVEPSAIPKLSKTMLSRCESGIIVGVDTPEKELRTRILEQLAKTIYPNEVIPLEVMQYIGESFPRNVRDLTGLLTKLIAYCTFSRTHITVEVARRVLGDVQKPENQVTLEQVLTLVENDYQISREKLLSKSKIRVASLPRKVAMYLLRKNTSMTLHTIGACFNRDYSTVIFSLKAMTRLLEKNEELSHRVATLNDSLNR